MSVATVTSVKNDKWKNKHETVTQPFEKLFYIELPDGDGATIIRDMRATATAMQGIFKEAIAAGKRLRCLGGAWSLSECAVTDGWLLSTKSLNLYWTMEQQQVHASYNKDIKGLYLAQCGLCVQELNEIAERDGRSLTTSGASNGQTIAGAIATGTHGSAFQYGSMTEYVVGFHLIVSPDEVLWVERASYPVASEDFAAELGVTLLPDDDLFNAILVSFGSFGIVAGIMIETEPKYLFEAQRMRLPLDDDLRKAMNTMNLAHLKLPHPGETPWHFEVTFNPHDVAGGGYVRTLYKRPYTNHVKPVMPSGELGAGEGLLSIIGSITGLVDATNVSMILDLLAKKNLPLYGPETGTNSEIFGLTTLRGKAMSMELGIAMEDSTKVLDLILDLHPEIDVYAGVISYRWVKQSKATMGFTKFPVTATIEFNAAHGDRTLALYNRIWAELEAKGISYTLHWGQMNNFTPARIRNMYGDAVDQWIKCRNLVMNDSAKAVFNSGFMESTGLG